MRRKLEASRPRHDLKRGAGGLADVEFIVQYLQLLHSSGEPELLRSTCGTRWPRCGGTASSARVCMTGLRDAYEFLRTIEGRLRLIHNRNISELPENRGEIERLARRLSDESADPALAVESFLAEAESKTRRTREIFEQIVVADATG